MNLTTVVSDGCIRVTMKHAIIVSTIIDAVVNSRIGTILLVKGLILVISDVQSEVAWGKFTVTPEKQSTKDGLGKDIENTIEDRLGVRGNDITALGKSPSNRVKEPKKDSPDTAELVNEGYIFGNSLSMLTTNNHNIIGDEEQSNSGEDEVAPFV